MQILERGGNAVDAAVAANAMMGLVAPMSNGIGGDLFAIVYDAKSGKLYGLNASGWAPSGLTIDFLNDKGFQSMPITGIYSATVPGAVDGWQKLFDRFGKKKISDVLAPAIRPPTKAFPLPNGSRSFGAPTPTFFAETRPRPRPIFPITAPPQSDRSSAIPISRTLSS